MSNADRFLASHATAMNCTVSAIPDCTAADGGLDLLALLAATVGIRGGDACDRFGVGYEALHRVRAAFWPVSKGPTRGFMLSVVRPGDGYRRTYGV